MEDMAWLGGHSKECRVCVPDDKLPFKQPERRPLGPRRSHAAAQAEAFCPSIPPSIHRPARESMEHEAFSPHRGGGRGDQQGQHSTLAWTPSPFLRHSSDCFPQTRGRWLRVPAGIPCASPVGRGHAGLTRGLAGPRLRLPRGTLAGA